MLITYTNQHLAGLTAVAPFPFDTEPCLFQRQVAGTPEGRTFLNFSRSYRLDMRGHIAIEVSFHVEDDRTLPFSCPSLAQTRPFFA